MNILKTLRLLAPLAGLGLLGACSGLPEQTDTETTGAEIIASGAIQDARTGSFGERRARVRVNDIPYVAPTKRPVEEPLPTLFSEYHSIIQASVVPVTYAADRLSQLTGLRVIVQDDVLSYLKGGSGGLQAAEVGEEVKELTQQYSGGTSALGSDVLIDMAYSGPLSGLLDRMAASLSASWKYDSPGRAIVFFRYETRVFALEMTQSSQKVTSNVTNQSTSSAGSSLTTSTELDVNYYNSIQADITSMLSSQGKATVSVATSTVTVTDTPQVLDRVATYVNRLNRSASREVLVEVKVVNVALNDSDNRGLNLDLLRENLSATFSFGTVRDVQGFATLTGTVADTVTGDLAPWAGSSVIIDALARQGRVSTVRNIMLRSLNGQAVPFQDTRRIAYIGQSSTLIGTNAPAQTTRQLSFETVGFSIRLLPHIMEDARRMMLHTWISISNLDRLDTFGDGADILQAPQTSQTDFQERFGITSGQTLLMVGFDQQVNSTDYRSLGGDARWWGLGGAREAARNHSVTVFLITPVIVESPRA